MKIVIVGAGDVGKYLCKVLSEDGHSVTLIESDEATVTEVEENLDVRVVKGNGASAKHLTLAGAQSCDYLIAMTQHDQLNIVSCAIASKLGARKTIARVHDLVYTDTELFNYQRHFNLDILINPEALTAVELAKYIRNPARFVVEDFARGQIELQEIEISKNAKVANKPLKDLVLPNGLKIGYVESNGVLTVPTASTELKAGDKVTILGSPEILLKNAHLFSEEISSEVLRIVLYGATETSVALIRRLNNNRFKIRVIEPNLQKCKTLAEQFPNVTVINGSATSLRLLEEEQIGSIDYFVACTKDDEENVMTCLQAKKLGAKHVELVINKPDYEQVIQNISGFLNITSAASPRKSSVAEIRKYITNKDYLIAGSLKNGDIEFIEVKVSENSWGEGKPLHQLNMPPATIIAAIVDDKNNAKVPGANDIINANDRLIIILEKKNVRQVVDMFIEQ
ncbi:MAG: Trk system potassium transporter TrkA [Verrucomicrobiaceae bacterium]|nr:Trk system potassium transporter TrkA [Verrucomicrobiaceae bacterium]